MLIDIIIRDIKISLYVHFFTVLCSTMPEESKLANLFLKKNLFDKKIIIEIQILQSILILHWCHSVEYIPDQSILLHSIVVGPEHICNFSHLENLAHACLELEQFEHGR